MFVPYFRFLQVSDWPIRDAIRPINGMILVSGVDGLFSMKQFNKLIQICENNSQLELAVLIGSRASNTSATNSDWDIALQWHRGVDAMTQLANTEQLRRHLAKSLEIAVDRIDLINIQSAGLAMRESIANEGVILKGENTLALSHFLNRTWRELEEYYWEKLYAA